MHIYKDVYSFFSLLRYADDTSENNMTTNNTVVLCCTLTHNVSQNASPDDFLEDFVYLAPPSLSVPVENR